MKFFESCASFSSSVGGALRAVCAKSVEDQEGMHFSWSSLLTKNFDFRLRFFCGRGAVLEVTVDCSGFARKFLFKVAPTRCIINVSRMDLIKFAPGCNVGWRQRGVEQESETCN